MRIPRDSTFRRTVNTGQTVFVPQPRSHVEAVTADTFRHPDTPHTKTRNLPPNCCLALPTRRCNAGVWQLRCFHRR